MADDERIRITENAMPLKTCPVTEKMVAEFALGPKRMRLSPEEAARVEAHVKTCVQCQKDLALYREKATDPGFYEWNPDATPDIIASTQNVAARFAAHLNERATEKAEIDVGRKWRKRALWIVAGTAIVTLAIVLSLEPPPPPPPVIVVQEPGPGALAADMSEEEKAAAEAYARRANEAINELRSTLEGRPPLEALALLDAQRVLAARESSAYAQVAKGRLAVLTEQLWQRSRKGPAESEVLLALTRAYGAAGMSAEWLQTFETYASHQGEQASWTALGQGKGDAAAERAARDAAATAYFDEVKRLYESEDYTSAILLGEKLETLPAAKKAWEGLVVVARAYLANGHPSGAIASYTKILDGCPDERFAREAGKAVLKMLLYADELNQALAQAASLRERFTDSDFAAFSHMIEGFAHERKGKAPEAMRAFRAALEAKGDSPVTAQADERIRELRNSMVEEMKLQDF
jgi:tetratricopeptide (TPR) repeat protein